MPLHTLIESHSDAPPHWLRWKITPHIIFAKYRKYSCPVDGSEPIGPYMMCRRSRLRTGWTSRLLFTKRHLLAFASKDLLDNPLEIDYSRKRGLDNDFVKYLPLWMWRDGFQVRVSLEKRHTNVTPLDRTNTLHRSFIARKQGSGMQGKLTIQDLARQARISKTAPSQVFNQNPSTPWYYMNVSCASYKNTASLSSFLKFNGIFVVRLSYCLV